MKLKLFLTAIYLVLFASFAFADIAIYCPKCKTHLYNYKHDEMPKEGILKAGNFLPATDSISSPQKGQRITCPIDGAPLNGWEYWASLQHFKSFFMPYQAISFLTKDKDGKWLWVPYDVQLLNMNEDKDETGRDKIMVWQDSAL